jgi:signal peptidase II
LIDQVSKLIVRGISIPLFNIHFSGLSPGESRPVLGDIIHITLVENPGIAFGIDPGESLRDVILIITILTCIVFFLYLLIVKSAEVKTKIAVALILGGAAGNLFDRIFYGIFYNYAPLFQGNVVDFIDIRIFKFFIFNEVHGNYVFNFADISILSGVILLVYVIMSSKKKRNIEKLIPQIAEDGEKST